MEPLPITFLNNEKNFFFKKRKKVVCFPVTTLFILFTNKMKLTKKFLLFLNCEKKNPFPFLNKDDFGLHNSLTFSPFWLKRETNIASRWHFL